MRIIRHSYPTIDNKEVEAVRKVLEARNLTQGEYVERLERKISKFIGTKYAVAVNSGTSALHLALMSLGVGRGDEIIIPTFVCSALLNAINYTGAQPVLADINEYDFNISFEDVRRKITKRTKAIVVPHLFGLPADLDKFLKLDVSIIEDCAQAIGARYKGEYVGKFGKLSMFSFYATKMITTGEGGMLLTNSSKWTKMAKDLRSYDNKDSYRIRYNYKLSDINAAVGLVQFSKLSDFIVKRREIADIYSKELKDISNVVVPNESAGKLHVYFRYCINTKKDSSEYIKSLQKKGIEVKKPIYKPIHRYLGFKDSDFPNTARTFKSVVSLPIYPELSIKEAERVVGIVRKTITGK